MTTHKRLSPGIEFDEIDRSDYGKRDYSITGTTVFMTGFAKKGEDYTAQWVNTMRTFDDLYGEPSNEPERYLYNCANEIINRGGVAVVAKLPYDNASKDCFSAVKYEIVQSDDAVRKYVDAINAVDSSLTSVLSIRLCQDEPTSRITMDRFDRMKVNNALDLVESKNRIMVVDITRGHYGGIDLAESNGKVSDDVEMLGLMPVFTGAVNAMFYQGLIPSVTSCDISGNEFTSGLGDYTPVADARNRTSADVTKGITGAHYAELSSFAQYEQQNASVPLSSPTLADECVSKMAVDKFPDIGYTLSGTVDRKHMKHVGLVVFRVFKDTANGNKVNFQPVESFVGSLDRQSKDESTGASDYIGDVVNAGSRYVNLFASVKTDETFKKAQSFVTNGQNAPVLGFARCELDRHIDFKTSIIDSLNVVLDRVSDPNQTRIDVVVDAGVSNIASFSARHAEDAHTNPNDYDMFNSDMYPFFQMNGRGSCGGMAPWSFDDALPCIGRWFQVISKFDDFCKYQRRDCMFVADMFRPIVLDGNEKVVRNTDPTSSIASKILPRMKYVAGLNSSYSAGYSNWFYSVDGRSGDFFWCPPSVKAVGVYVYTDAYFHEWDAPAGLNRGVVRDAYDISYNPRNDEAGKIYQQAWNYAVGYPVEGIVVEGQKTFQLKPTALDRVNVRRLMLWLEKRVVAIARRFLYEGNTSYMRQRFVDQIRPIFEQAKTGNGIIEYAIRCDDELNDADTIDRNELRCVCAVKPVKTIEYIKLGFIISNQSASVSEEVMK